MTLSIAMPICPLCGATKQEPYAAFAELLWVKCGCGLVFKQKVVDPQAESAVGGEGSFGATGYGRRYDRRRRHRIAKSVRQIRDAMEYLSGDAVGTPSLLDIGCSLGYTLEAGRSLGMTAMGVDVSQVAVDYCRGLGFDAKVATLESLPFADASFSVVVMKHVLEHTRQPSIALSEAKRVLKHGGALFIAVPHAGYHKAVVDPARSSFFRPDRSGGIEHWIYYTPDTLARILRAGHFNVVRTHPVLLHRKAGLLLNVLDWLCWTPKVLVAYLRTQLRLRKEFWTIAVRD